MLPITYLFSEPVKALIAEYNHNRKMNIFLYNNEDVHQWFRQKYLKSEHSDYIRDRFVFVDRANQIECELLLLLRDQFNGREVMSIDKWAKGPIRGKIEINLTRTYEGRTFDDNLAMRGVDDGNALVEQTVAFWVVTKDQFTTHLYTADQIMLAFPTDEEKEILMDYYQMAAEAHLEEEREKADAMKEFAHSAKYDLNGNER